MEEDHADLLHHGCCTSDEYRWICETCFHDFNAMFQWKIGTGSKQGKSNLTN
jgi:hypothetical protein